MPPGETVELPATVAAGVRISEEELEEELRLLEQETGAAPKSSSRRMTLWWPDLSATRTGVRPNWSAWLGLAWCRSSTRTTSSCPSCAAMHSAVAPWLQVWSTWASLSSSRLTTVSWPCQAALCSAVRWSLSTAFTLACKGGKII